MSELTEAQIARQDFVDNLIFQTILSSHPCADGIEWDIEMIADIRERIRYWLAERFKLVDENRFYPSIES